MPKRIYYVGFENVRLAGLAGAGGLQQSDVVNIFYSAKTDSISIDLFVQLKEHAAEVNYIKV